MSEPETSDHGWTTRHARTTLPYRLAVWYLRLATVSLPLAFIDFDRLWPIWPSVILLGFICVSPVRYLAYFEWKLQRDDLVIMLWRDAFSPGFR
ncbi:hypothetical protein [Micromonospora phaseoli]|uniref:hypothetical protein n=1 Tax=Micromonospora phaseoli TaxID=1144548 RepID=UPI001113F589|nr:hypothetical protein [Micromonospora phaseoli]